MPLLGDMVACASSMGFVAVDWGSSRLRAYRVEPSGVSERLVTEQGILSTPREALAAALVAALAPWREWIERDRVPVRMAGMIGMVSRFRDYGCRGPRYLRMPRCLTCLALFALLALLVPRAAAAGGVRVIPSENYELDLTPDLHLSFDGEFLHVRSPLAEALLSAPYGSSRKGWADFIDHAAVTPSGYVGIHYRSNCDDKLLLQATSLNVLRAKLLIARAEQHADEADALIKQAQALAPAEPTAAVARAKAYLQEPERAARLLAPALSAARFDTYFEILRQAPTLRDVPLVRQLRAPHLGDAKLDAAGSVLGISGSLVALSVSPETEADCSAFEELLLLDTNTGEVVFRRPTLLVDSECRETAVNTRELNQLLADFGFDAVPAPTRAESTDYRQFALEFEPSGLGLSIDIDQQRASVKLGQGAPQTLVWDGDSPRFGQWLPTLRAIIVASNRDSDVCEGLPSLDLLRVPGGPNSTAAPARNAADPPARRAMLGR